MAVTVKPVLNSNKNKDGLQHVLIRVISQRKPAYITTGVYVKKAWFNPAGTLDKANWIKTGTDMHAIYNNSIKSILAKILAQPNINEPVTAAQIKKQVTVGSQKDFMAFFKKELIHIKATNEYNTWAGYDNVYKMLEKFLNGKALYFKDIDLRFIKDLETHWRKDTMESTTHAYLSSIRAILNKAVKEKIIKHDDNPFTDFKVKSVRGKKDRLTLAELQKIITVELVNTREQQSRDVFLFQFYCHGMRVGDALTMKNKQIEVSALSYTSQKRDKPKSVQFTPEAAAIINKYANPKKPNNYLFPFLSNDIEINNKEIFAKQLKSKVATVDYYLKNIATRAGINKRISSHTARHSMADIARKHKVDLYTISKSLGHATLKETEGYLNSMDQESYNEEMENFYTKIR